MASCTNNTSAVYTVEIFGNNNNFTIEATISYEPSEDWLPGKVIYDTYIEKAVLVHGSRRRDVTDLLTEEQQQQITDEINRIAREDYGEYQVDRYLNSLEDSEREFENTIGSFLEDAGIC